MLMQIALDADRDMMESAKRLDDKLAKLISSLEHKYPNIPSSDIKQLIRLYALSLFNSIDGMYQFKDGVLDIGRAVFSLMESDTKSGGRTVWRGLSAWRKGFNMMYAALDVYYLISEVHDIIRIYEEIQEYERTGKSTSEAAKKLEEVIFELEQHRNELIELMTSGN